VVVDFDDFHEEENRLDLLHALKAINPKFKCTVFAIPALGSEEFWRETPEWIELAVHGWRHPHPREAAGWTYSEAMFVLSYCSDIFAHGFKAPGWRISDETYTACMDAGWWVADHWDNDRRRPQGLLTHRIAPDYALTNGHWHGHIPNVCGNGIEETFPALSERVVQALDFQFVSEAVKPWRSATRTSGS
jgi:hypothetical protein